MRRIPVLAVVVGVLSSVGAVVLSVQPVAGGISSSPPASPGEVLAFPPDGGLQITLAGERVDTNVTNTYVPVAGIDGARVDVDPGPVTITGTVDTNVTNIPTVALQNGTQVSLSSTSLDALTAATGKGDCTYNDGDPTATIGGTAENIPASPLASRTAITIWNHSNNHTLICSASGTATATKGLYIYGDGQWWKWEGLSAGVLISCVCQSGTCTYGYLEERCYQ